MKRQFKNSPEFPFEIDGQRVVVLVNDEKHLFVKANDPVRIRGIPYTGTLHVEKYVGLWTSYYQVPGRPFSFEAKRADQPFQKVSTAASRAMEDLLVKAADAFARAYPERLVQGARVAVNNEIYRADEQIEKVRLALDELIAERQLLISKEHALPPDESVEEEPSFRM